MTEHDNTPQPSESLSWATGRNQHYLIENDPLVRRVLGGLAEKLFGDKRSDRPVHSKYVLAITEDLKVQLLGLHRFSSGEHVRTRHQALKVVEVLDGEEGRTHGLLIAEEGTYSHCEMDADETYALDEMSKALAKDSEDSRSN